MHTSDKSMSQGTHKDKFDGAFHEIAQYQQIINSLREQIAEYNTKLETMISQGPQQKNNDLLLKEIAKYKSKLGSISSEIVQYQQIINSLREQINEYNNNLDTTISQKTKHKKN